MNATHESNSAAAARFIVHGAERGFEPELIDAAKMCLVDWFGVTLGAHGEPAAQAVRNLAEAWHAPGPARVLLGGRTPPDLAALVNGTMAHCLDFDDTHVGSLAHLSGPTWAATLALAELQGASEATALAAFITGFEVGGRMGGGGFGVALTERGFHSTGVMGRLAATAAACHVLGLDEEQVAHALGLAATQAGGLTGSFGTMAKPFHAGKAAMDGVLSARLAAEGFEGAPALLDGDGGLAAAMVQDGSRRIGPLEFSAGWELTRNTFKPYAACLLTHPSIDAARQLAAAVVGQLPQAVRVRVNPLVVQVANIPAPTTPLEGKFSVAYCVALGLQGHAAQAADFTAARLDDPRLRTLLERVRVQPDPETAKTAAGLEVELADGRTLQADIPVALGNPENPMGWEAMETKFMSLTDPVLGDRAPRLLETLRRFDAPGALSEAMGLVAGAEA